MKRPTRLLTTALVLHALAGSALAWEMSTPYRVNPDADIQRLQEQNRQMQQDSQRWFEETQRQQEQQRQQDQLDRIEQEQRLDRWQRQD